MRAIALLNRTIVATVLVAASVPVFAGGGGGGPRGSELHPYSHTTVMAAAAGHADAPATAADAPSTGTGGATSGKTREQVRAELLQAEETGFLPIHKNDYPPSAATVARNQARFQQVEQAWQAHSEITAAQK